MAGREKKLQSYSNPPPWTGFEIRINLSNLIKIS
jgi:hypothetical protein